jgi:hypothetical protein
MTDEKTIREFIQNKLNEKSRRELTYIETVYDLQEFCKHLQTEAINYTRCCTEFCDCGIKYADKYAVQNGKKMCIKCAGY